MSYSLASQMHHNSSSADMNLDQHEMQSVGEIKAVDVTEFKIERSGVAHEEQLRKKRINRKLATKFQQKRA